MEESKRERNRQYLRDHYQRNKQYYKDKSTKRQKEIGAFLWQLKVDGQCKNCGEGHPATLDFHHRDPSQKEIVPARMRTHGWSQERILQEYAK